MNIPNDSAASRQTPGIVHQRRRLVGTRAIHLLAKPVYPYNLRSAPPGHKRRDSKKSLI
jgi:hypothetical protein